MRSFTKKNTEYTCSGIVGGNNYNIGNSFYQLLYADGANDHIQKLRSEFEKPVFVKAAKALVSLAVQWKKDDWNTKNPASVIDITGMIDVNAVKRAFIELAGEDYVKNENGATAFDIIDSPQSNKKIDFNSIKNTDGVAIKAIEKLVIEKQFLNPEKIKDILKKAPFDLDKAPDNIPDIVLKNAAALVVLKQVLSAVRIRSGYENLYGFTFHDPVGTPQIKLNHFIYRSAVPISQGVMASLQTGVDEARRVKVKSTKPDQSTPLVNTALAIQKAAGLFKDFIDNNNRPGTNDIKNVKDFSKITGTVAGKAKAIDAIEVLANSVEMLKKGKKFNDCTKEIFDGIKIAKEVCTIVGNSAPAKTNTNTATNPNILSDIIENIKQCFGSLETQFKDQPPINSDKFNLTPIISKFDCKTPNTPIVAPQNAIIRVLAPGHIKFVDTFNVVIWQRQSMGPSEGAGLSIIPFDEGEKLVDGYINSANRDTIKDSIEKQGKAMIEYIEKHFGDSAEKGYRRAKRNMIFNQGLYCAFCETPFADGRVADIEHKLPKSIFPTQALNWGNFVLCCKVCNSDFKKEKYIWKGSDDNGPSDTFLLNAFDSRIHPGTKNYLECRGIAEREVLWPDKKHAAVGIGNAHALLPFQVIANSKPPLVSLANIKITTSTIVHTKMVGPTETHQIDFTDIANVGTVNDVSVVLKKMTNLPANNGLIGVEASADHIISICGLDATGPSYWNDQRIVSRTKAWLNAMKQLKILADININKFARLRKYYQDQLHPLNIKRGTAVTVQSNIEKLTSTVPVKAVVMDILSGTIKVAADVANGSVEVDLATSNATTNPNSAGVQVNVNFGAAKINDNVVINSGSLSGEIMEVAGTRIMTGRMIMKTKIPGFNINDKIILFRDVEVNRLAINDTRINIAAGQAVISDDVALLNTWDENRGDLLKIIDQTTAILKEYIWENITDMVRFGGYYSTWVRTFQENRPTRDGRRIPYDLELVKRLEEKAMENYEDPFQFHGTDTEEIIACL